MVQERVRPTDETGQPASLINPTHSQMFLPSLFFLKAAKATLVPRHRPM